MDFGQKKFREIDLFDFATFFGPDFFNFLAHCGVHSSLCVQFFFKVLELHAKGQSFCVSKWKENPFHFKNDENFKSFVSQQEQENNEVIFRCPCGTYIILLTIYYIMRCFILRNINDFWRHFKSHFEGGGELFLGALEWSFCGPWKTSSSCCFHFKGYDISLHNFKALNDNL